MKNKYYLKRQSVNILLITIIVGLIGLTAYVSYSIINSLSVDNTSYVMRDIIEDTYPVINEVKMKYNKPFDKTNVNISINYYSSGDEAKEQERSLIVYDNTYLPNTGILYSSTEPFEVLSSFEGKVTNIEESELFGKIIEVTYNNNIIAKYSSISEANVLVGDTVNQGEVIGISGTNKISSESENMLLFELIVNGTNVDPENYFGQEIENQE